MRAERPGLLVSRLRWRVGELSAGDTLVTIAQRVTRSRGVASRSLTPLHASRQVLYNSLTKHALNTKRACARPLATPLVLPGHSGLGRCQPSHKMSRVPSSEQTNDTQPRRQVHLDRISTRQQAAHAFDSARPSATYIHTQRPPTGAPRAGATPPCPTRMACRPTRTEPSASRVERPGVAARATPL